MKKEFLPKSLLQNAGAFCNRPAFGTARGEGGEFRARNFPKKNCKNICETK